MASERIEVDVLLRHTWEAITAAPVAAIGYIVALSALGTMSDVYTQESSGGFFLVSIASFVAGYFLLRAMLQGGGLLPKGEGGGFGVYFGVSFLGGLGTVLGFLLLVIPGLVLMVRWSAAFALALTENTGASDALSRSWDLTRGNFWPIFAVLLVGLAPLVVFIFVAAAGVGYADALTGDVPTGLFEIVASNLLANLYSVFSSALGIAVYWMLRDDRPELSEVFA